MRILRASESLNLGLGLSGLYNAEIIQYHIRRASTSGEPLFVSIKNQGTTPTYTNIFPGSSFYPLYTNKNNDPVYLNNPLQISDELNVFNDSRMIDIEIRDANNNIPIFDEIFILLRVRVVKDPQSQYILTQPFFSQYVVPAMQQG